MQLPERMFCPVRKRPVVASPNGRYWYCPACGGWHRYYRCPVTGLATEPMLWGIDHRTGKVSWLCPECLRWHGLENG